MKVTLLFAISSIIAAVSAQTPTRTTYWDAPTEFPSPTTLAEINERDDSNSTTSTTTHTVSVGSGGNFMMDPNVTSANVGDTVEFVFYPTGHWVIQGDEIQACIPYQLAHPGKIGFSSGPMNVTDVDDLPRYRVRINDTVPIFYYCGAPESCTTEHMVGAINPNTSTDFTFEHYYESSKSVSYQLVPGDSWPSEGGSSSSSTTSTSSSGSTATSTSPKTTHTVTHSGATLSGGAIAGIVVGAVAVFVFGGILVYFCGRRGGVEWAQKRHWPWTSVPQSPGKSISPAISVPDPTDPNSHPSMAPHAHSPPISPGMQTSRSVVTSDGSHYSGVFNMSNVGTWPTNTPPVPNQHPAQLQQQYQMNQPVAMPMGIPMQPQMSVYQNGFVPQSFPTQIVAPHQQLYHQSSASLLQSGYASGAPSPPLAQPPNPLAELPASPIKSQSASARSPMRGQSELPSPSLGASTSSPPPSPPQQQPQQQQATIDAQIMESPVIMSPLPRYSSAENSAGARTRNASGNPRTYSFTQGEESSYRPAKN